MAARNADTLAALCRRERDRRDWTQAEAACAIGVHLRTYQRWEAGETMPRAAERRAVARTLNISVAILRRLCRLERMP